MKRPDDFLILPDKFTLTKQEMLRVFDKVSSHWDRDDFSTLQNAAYTSIMELTKLSIKLNDIKVLEKIWYSILMFVEEMQTLNALKNEAETEPLKQDLLDIEWNRIESGEAFIDN